MRMGSRPKRRGLILGAAASTAALGGLAVRELTGHSLERSDDAARIGARAWKTHGKKAEALWARRRGGGDVEWANIVRAARRADIDSGNLVEVDGWWLAETEVLVCVLVHRGYS